MWYLIIYFICQVVNRVYVSGIQERSVGGIYKSKGTRTWIRSKAILKDHPVELPYDPAIPILDLYLKKMKWLPSCDICTLMFTAALFTIAKVWKPPKGPLRDEQVKKMWECIYMYILYSQLKKETLAFATTWTNCEGIMRSDISQTEKDKHWHLTSRWNPKRRTPGIRE